MWHTAAHAKHYTIHSKLPCTTQSLHHLLFLRRHVVVDDNDNENNDGDGNSVPIPCATIIAAHFNLTSHRVILCDILGINYKEHTQYVACQQSKQARSSCVRAYYFQR